MQNYEKAAYILSSQKRGKSRLIRGRAGHIVQAIGENGFAFLELLAKDESDLTVGERQSVDRTGREKIIAVLGKLAYRQLSEESKTNLERVCLYMVREDESKFVSFFNIAGPVSIRTHSLELLPNLGKARLEKILRERDGVPFTSYSDIEKRTGLNRLEERIVQRLLIELKGEERTSLFVKRLSD